MSYQIVSFYRFTPFSKSDLKRVHETLIKTGKEKEMVGLILLSKEGINATLSGKKESIDTYLRIVEQVTDINDFFYKKSPSSIPAFKQLRIKIKKEIITFGKKEISADFGFHNLEPDEWESMLNEKQITVLDIRNDYEVEVGQFKKAKDLGLKEFSEFPQKIKSTTLPKEQKTLLYCTGGIRCEKAIIEMRKQGFKELYQLKGGILNYLKLFPDRSFEGECFVFDHRVAVDQKLNPSKKYSLCPHCGQAAAEPIHCVHCEKKAKVCKHCLKKQISYLETCTKNCAYHFRMGHKYKTSKTQH
ncbi:MAG: rhodanese-like domain-containing protein [Bdellovibrionales bacterium]|nr:rhodanese-like domain-containing protein [Bdellovibrionales bacterium]